MTFASLGYLTFLLLLLPAYRWTPVKQRWILFLAASYYFYGCWNIKYSLLMLASTVFSYWGALWVAPGRPVWLRKTGLVFGVGLNLAMLAGFKYWNFFREETGQVAGWFGLSNPLPVFEVLLPVGISFYTFQALSYVIDVYRGQQPAERHLGWYSTYHAFFPQLVAGPIERVGHLLGQLKNMPARLREEDLAEGFRLILWGLFMKLVVADNLAALVDQIALMKHPRFLQGIILMGGFGLQIYFDFNAYSTIAIGSARLFGVNLMDNFRRPYMATSIRDFWRRWHISLTTWFRDYVYFPLGGNRVEGARWALNIAAVFVLSGLWHGAGLTFLVWGAGHAGLYLLESALRDRPLGQHLRQLPVWIRRLAVFQLAGILWLFFRASSLAQAGEWIKSMAEPKRILSLRSINFDGGIVAGILMAALILWMEARSEKSESVDIMKWTRLQRWGVYALAAYGILLFGRFGNSGFIYFQF